MVMMIRSISGSFALFLVAIGPLAFAQEPKLLAPGNTVPSCFRAYVAADQRFEKGSIRNREDRMHCLVVDNALNPVIAVFTRVPAMGEGKVANAEIKKLAPKLQELVIKDKPTANLKALRLSSFVVFLTLGKEYPEDEKRDESAKDAKELATQLATPSVPFALAPGKSKSIEDWGIGEKETVRVIFYREMKVIQSWSFTADKPLGDEDVAKIEAAVVSELLPKK
jgi:hypothetical protein